MLHCGTLDGNIIKKENKSAVHFFQLSAHCAHLKHCQILLAAATRPMLVTQLSQFQNLSRIISSNGFCIYLMMDEALSFRRCAMLKPWR